MDQNDQHNEGNRSNETANNDDQSAKQETHRRGIDPSVRNAIQRLQEDLCNTRTFRGPRLADELGIALSNIDGFYRDLESKERSDAAVRAGTDEASQRSRELAAKQAERNAAPKAGASGPGPKFSTGTAGENNGVGGTGNGSVLGQAKSNDPTNPNADPVVSDFDKALAKELGQKPADDDGGHFQELDEHTRKHADEVRQGKSKSSKA